MNEKLLFPISARSNFLKSPSKPLIPPTPPASPPPQKGKQTQTSLTTLGFLHTPSQTTAFPSPPQISFPLTVFGITVHTFGSPGLLGPEALDPPIGPELGGPWTEGGDGGGDGGGAEGGAGAGAVIMTAGGGVEPPEEPP